MMQVALLIALAAAGWRAVEAWPANRAALALRTAVAVAGEERALDDPTRRAMLAGAGQGTADLAVRLRAEAGDVLEANRLLAAAPPDPSRTILQRHHLYAAAVTLRRWDVLARGLSTLPATALSSHGTPILGPATPGAALQRAAELVESRGDHAAAVEYARLAKAVIGSGVMAPDPGNARVRERDGDAVAAAAEHHRMAMTCCGMANGAFDWWTTPAGIVPGWIPDRPEADYRVKTDDGAYLEVCANPGGGVVWLRNEGFRASSGTRYLLRGRARLTTGAPTHSAYIGVHYLDAASSTTVGAYALVGPTPSGWISYRHEWTAPATAATAIFKIGVDPGPARSCVAFADLAATPLVEGQAAGVPLPDRPGPTR